MSKANELVKAGRELQINCSLLEETEAYEYINSVKQKYNPRKTSAHLAIGGESISIPLEKYEFLYSEHLDSEPAYVFFDQEGDDRKKVVMIEDGQKLCRVIENSFGIEYFVSNKQLDYLIAVNWYVIEGIGTAEKWLTRLI
ncbi:MAG: hypothetical protein WBG70_17970 [Spirulinaceae cyanobacterium]